MRLEAIFELWAEDSQIDRTDLGHESLKISNLHHKYYKIFANERLVLRALEADLKTLRFEKYEFFTQGPTRQTKEKGWELPPVGRVLKSDVSAYIEADKDIIALSLKIGLANEKVDLLESIIRSLQNRGFQIKTALDFVKFQNGQ
jgi:hypothetical protein